MKTGRPSYTVGAKSTTKTAEKGAELEDVAMPAKGRSQPIKVEPTSHHATATSQQVSHWHTYLIQAAKATSKSSTTRCDVQHEADEP
jgi:hypothetical protein